MSRIVVFAQNQVIVGTASSSIATSDPVALYREDRAETIASVHYLFGGAGAAFTITAQVSNDGTTWIEVLPNLNFTGAGVGRASIPVAAAFMRFEYKCRGPSGFVVACFDVHAELDHA